MIYVVVALPAEARPLISHFQLERVEAAVALPIHRRSDLAVIEAGVGKESVTAAVETLAEIIPSEISSVWLNLGVAGHRDHDIGTAVLARQVLDEETGAIFELTPPAEIHLPLGEVLTVSRVETEFESAALYEMEASAFCQQTLDRTSAELVQVLKIVSDNRRSGTLCVSAHQVQGLIEDNLPTVDLLVSSLHRQSRQLSR